MAPAVPGRSLLYRRWFGALLGLVLATALTACGGSSDGEASRAAAQAAPPGPLDAGPGETVEREGVSITIVEVGATRSFDRSELAAAGKVFITARLSIHNTGTQELAQGADALVLELPDGSVGKPWLPTPGSRLRGTGPLPGKHLDGWRSWEVPEGTRAATLSYRPTPDLEIRLGVTLSGEVRERWNVYGDLRHV